jgi:hypothetical protein
LGFSVLGQNITLSPTMVFMFFIRSWEGICLPWTPVYVVKFLLIWYSMKCILLLVFHHFNPTFSIAETIHGMHFGIFFTCEYVRHFENPTILNPAQRHSTAISQDSADAELNQVTALPTHFTRA